MTAVSSPIHSSLHWHKVTSSNNPPLRRHQTAPPSGLLSRNSKSKSPLRHRASTSITPIELTSKLATNNKLLEYSASRDQLLPTVRDSLSMDVDIQANVSKSVQEFVKPIPSPPPKGLVIAPVPLATPGPSHPQSPPKPRRIPPLSPLVIPEPIQCNIDENLTPTPQDMGPNILLPNGFRGVGLKRQAALVNIDPFLPLPTTAMSYGPYSLPQHRSPLSIRNTSIHTVPLKKNGLTRTTTLLDLNESSLLYQMTYLQAAAPVPSSSSKQPVTPRRDCQELYSARKDAVSPTPTELADTPLPPSPHPCVALARAAGIKVRDFAYENHGVPVAPKVQPRLEQVKSALLERKAVWVTANARLDQKWQLHSQSQPIPRHTSPVEECSRRVMSQPVEVASWDTDQDSDMDVESTFVQSAKDKGEQIVNDIPCASSAELVFGQPDSLNTPLRPLTGHPWSTTLFPAYSSGLNGEQFALYRRDPLSVSTVFSLHPIPHPIAASRKRDRDEGNDLCQGVRRSNRLANMPDPREALSIEQELPSKRRKVAPCASSFPFQLSKIGDKHTRTKDRRTL